MLSTQLSNYRLSPLYVMPAIETDEAHKKTLEAHAELEGLASGKSYILHQVVKDKIYIINHTIHYFLSLFMEDRSIDEVIGLVAKEANCTPNDVDEIIRNFVKKMKRKGVLISLEEYEKTLKFKDSDQKRVNMLVVGQNVHGYVVKEELSIRKGAELYIADRPDGRGTCVIKIMRVFSGWTAKKKKEATKSFFQEFKLLDDLSGHPTICELYDLFEEGESPVAVMEHIGGSSLRAWLKDGIDSLTIEDKIDILVQVTEGIAWVHQNGIFHGDIHLSNFLVDDGKVKVIDFGLGNRAEPESDEVINKGGVYQYIAPECLSTNSFKWLQKKADLTSEVYQLGVVIYYTLYRDLPFKAITWETLATMILEDEPILNEVDNQGNVIPTELLEICKKCLAKTPSDRHESAITLSEALLSLQKKYSSKRERTI